MEDVTKIWVHFKLEISWMGYNRPVMSIQGEIMTIQAISFGELLIDFVSTERDVAVGDAPAFLKAPGGAPANVAVGLAKLGIKTAFISQLGDDFFGHHLVDVVAAQGVNVSGVRFTDQAMTMLAFVSVDAEGERSFVFYRKPSADMLMTPDDLDMDLLRQTEILHYGSITLIDDPLRTTTLAAIEAAKTGGALISYDPNLREPLWESLDAAKQGILLGWEYANIIKVSDAELAFISDTNDIAAGVKKLWGDATQLVVVTKGANGCEAFLATQHWQVPSFAVQVEDTIGAGDGFVAGLLAGILKLGDGWQTNDLTDVLQAANAVGAITASRQGAIPALPTASEVAAFLNQHTQ